jgi:hypothetical protein
MGVISDQPRAKASQVVEQRTTLLVNVVQRGLARFICTRLLVPFIRRFDALHLNEIETNEPYQNKEFEKVDHIKVLASV